MHLYLAVKVKKICKIYRIGTKDEVHDNFAQSVFQWTKSGFMRDDQYRSQQPQGLANAGVAQVEVGPPGARVPGECPVLHE